MMILYTKMIIYIYVCKPDDFIYKNDDYIYTHKHDDFTCNNDYIYTHKNDDFIYRTMMILYTKMLILYIQQ